MSDFDLEYLKTSKIIKKPKTKKKNINDDFKDNRVQRINFKNFVRRVKEEEEENDLYDDFTDDYES